MKITYHNMLCKNETYTIDLVNNEIIKMDEVIEKYDVEPLYTYIEQLKYFMDCLQHHKKPMNNLEEANEVLKKRRSPSRTQGSPCILSIELESNTP